jgi:GH24 family phage-related lysozyme (muramidase)
MLYVVVLLSVLAVSMPTITVPQIKDNSKTTLVRHENAITTEKGGEFFVETGEGALLGEGNILEGPFEDKTRALIRSKTRSVETNVKDIAALRNTIRNNEGTRHTTYKDKLNNLTVGVGFSLTRSDVAEKLEEAGIDATALLRDNLPLTTEQVDNLFDLSLADALTDVRKVIPDFDNLTASRQNALADMMFQLGEPRFRTFKRMINAVNQKNWPRAIKELLDSRLALEQTPGRAKRNASKMETVPSKISERFSNPIFTEPDQPLISPPEGFIGIEPIPSGELQKQFKKDLKKRLTNTSLSDLGSIALSKELITESGLTIISRKDLITLILRNSTLSAPSKGI